MVGMPKMVLNMTKLVLLILRKHEMIQPPNKRFY